MSTGDGLVLRQVLAWNDVVSVTRIKESSKRTQIDQFVPAFLTILSKFPSGQSMFCIVEP